MHKRELGAPGIRTAFYPKWSSTPGSRIQQPHHRAGETRETWEMGRQGRGGDGGEGEMERQGRWGDRGDRGDRETGKTGRWGRPKHRVLGVRVRGSNAERAMRGAGGEGVGGQRRETSWELQEAQLGSGLEGGQANVRTGKGGCHVSPAGNKGIRTQSWVSLCLYQFITWSELDPGKGRVSSERLLGGSLFEPESTLRRIKTPLVRDALGSSTWP